MTLQGNPNIELGAITPQAAQWLLQKAAADGVQVSRAGEGHWTCLSSNGQLTYNIFFCTADGKHFAACTCPARICCKHIAKAAGEWKRELIEARRAKRIETKLTETDYDAEAEAAIAEAERHIQAARPATKLKRVAKARLHCFRLTPSIARLAAAEVA